MPVSFRLGAFYFLFFVTAGLMVAYVPPYLAKRGLSASEIAWVLAAPQLARVLAPGAWGALAVLASGFCMAAAHGTLYAFFTLHLQRLGYGSALIGFLWMLGVAAEVAVFVFLPALFRRYLLSTLSWRAPRSAWCASWPSAGWRIGFCCWLPRRFSMRRPSAPFTRQPLQRYSGFFPRTLKRAARPCSRAWLMAQAAPSAR